MQRLAQELNNAFSFCLISATQQVDHNNVAGKHTFGEGLWRSLGVENVDGLTGERNEICIFLHESTEEFVCLATSFDHDVVVSHLLEKLVADEAVAAGQKDALSI